jgi:hypothetical protein
MDTDTRRTTMDDLPPDQAPAADPALDALDLLDADEYRHSPLLGAIRTALADRITADEARIAFEWMDDLTQSGRIPSSEAAALITRLGKIAGE